MTSSKLNRYATIAAMSDALRKHITAPGSLDCGRKRQAAYIIEDIEADACIRYDVEAHFAEQQRRRLCDEPFASPRQRLGPHTLKERDG